MTTLFFPNSERHYTQQSWLQSFFSFSFADWYDPHKLGFGKLRVLNDDTIAPKNGFSKHPHDNMEVITIVTQGILEHEDSLGNKKQIPAGDVQIMTTGTGVVHSEMNPQPHSVTKLIQLWIKPGELNVTPAYHQKTFSIDERDNAWQVIVSNDSDDVGALPINQDTRLSLGCFDGGQKIQCDLTYSGNGAYIFVLKGTIHIDEHRLRAKDALGVDDTDSFVIDVLEDAEILLIEVPMT